MDGLFTEETYLNHSIGIGQNNLTEFTVCLRFNLNYLRQCFLNFINFPYQKIQSLWRQV